MNLYNIDWPFWLAVAGATIFRIVSSPLTSVRTVAAGVVGGIFAAMVFTDPLLFYFNIPPEVYRNGAAALLTLTGESLMRTIMSSANDPSKLMQIWKSFRGGK